MKKNILLAVLCACTLSIFAHDFHASGICYNFLGGDSVAVTCRGTLGDDYYDEYSGSVTIPETVACNNTTYRITTIGDEAFLNCRSLTSITIPNSVTTIGDEAFLNCRSLQYNIHDSANYLGNSENPYHALISATNTSITSCTIHENTKVIAGGAFYGCSRLTSLTLGNSVTIIGYVAFSGCSNLTSITIPNSVTTIGESAFNGCSSLTSITIPNSVTTIGDRAFEFCSGLTSITCKAVTPPTIDKHTFREIDRSTPLYVLEESIEAYKAAEYWKEFTNIQAISESTTGIANDMLQDNVIRKVFENNTIYILRNGEKYTINGRKVE